MKRHGISDLLRRTLLPAVALLCIVALTVSQTSKPSAQKPKSSQTATSKKKSRAQRQADSLAAFRADSLRQVLEQARQDSLKRAAEEEERRVRDSIAITSLRKLDNRAFGPGERLAFDISYGVITAGRALLTVVADSVKERRCYRVEMLVNSHPSFSWIYKVEDRYLTYIDQEALVPWRFEQHIREGGYQRDFIAEFDQIHHQARTSEGVYEIPPYVHDIMSAFFFVRTLDLSSSGPGDRMMLQNFYKDKTHDLGVKFLGRQELEVEAGKFRTIVLEPMVREGGLFKSEGRIVVWLTDDERKMPIRVNAKIMIGSIDVELSEYSGLNGPLPSKIE